MANKAEEKKAHKSTGLISNEANRKIPFSVVEAYKNLRLHLISVLSEKNKKVVAVTSSNASEGKSTTSVNIAITLSQLNRRVLLIDADARRATVHTKLKLENKVGCIDVMAGNVSFSDAICKYNSSLDVLTTGSYENSGFSELFCSTTFDSLLEEAKEKYEYVIVDTPPINLVSDALVISQKCDGVVLVARTSATTYADFKAACNNIDKLKIDLLGTVLNGVGSKADRYYNDKYRYGYSYSYRYNSENKK